MGLDIFDLLLLRLGRGAWKLLRRLWSGNAEISDGTSQVLGLFLVVAFAIGSFSIWSY
jgi:hypothetical protein